MFLLLAQSFEDSELFWLDNLHISFPFTPLVSSLARFEIVETSYRLWLVSRATMLHLKYL